MAYFLSSAEPLYAAGWIGCEGAVKRDREHRVFGGFMVIEGWGSTIGAIRDTNARRIDLLIICIDGKSR
jgi:hypothetical protein